MSQSAREIAILGGGLAGLSLAVQLVHQAVDARITVIDPRENYSDDRTWCFWDVLNHPFRDHISHRWPQWRVTTSHGSVVAGTPAPPYCRLPSGAFYQAALTTLEAADNVTMELGQSVEAVRYHGDAVLVDTATRRITADLAFDARPPDVTTWATGGKPFLWQTFEGWRVSTRRPLSDADTVTLMDFTDRPSREAVGFLYTLPLSEHEALLESTAFMPATAAAAPDHRGHLERAINSWPGDTDCRIEAREQGRIPMTTVLPPVDQHPRIIPIGTRAGAPRPSSGYAFLPIQRHSARLAHQLAHGHWPTARVRGSVTRWLDGIFLRRLRRRPDAAPELFRRLFARVESERLVRFLTETGSLRDHLAVMSALPTASFAAEAALGPLRSLPEGP